MQEIRQGGLGRQYDELKPTEVEGVQLREIVHRDRSRKLVQSYEDARAQRVDAQDPTRPDPGPFEPPYTLRKVQMMKEVMDEEINKTTNVVSPSFSGRERICSGLPAITDARPSRSSSSCFCKSQRTLFKDIQTRRDS